MVPAKGNMLPGEMTYFRLRHALQLSCGFSRFFAVGGRCRSSADLSPIADGSRDCTRVLLVALVSDMLVWPRGRVQ